MVSPFATDLCLSRRKAFPFPVILVFSLILRAFQWGQVFKTTALAGCYETLPRDAVAYRACANPQEPENLKCGRAGGLPRLAGSRRSLHVRILID
jgi:hypothetical protein